MPLRCPLKCDVPTLYTTPFKYPRMRESLAEHSRESSGEDTSLVLITMLVAATRANRTFFQRLLGVRGICEKYLHATTSPTLHTQAVSSEWSSAGRASPCHRARPFAGNEPESRTLREALRYGCLTKSSPKTFGLLCTTWLKERDSTFALIGRGKNHRATCP